MTTQFIKCLGCLNQGKFIQCIAKPYINIFITFKETNKNYAKGLYIYLNTNKKLQQHWKREVCKERRRETNYLRKYQ